MRSEHQPDVRDLAQLLYEGWRNWAETREEGETPPLIVGRQVRSGWE